MKPQIIAFYLPQFHPFKENDEWWGKGFTEWTNVGKAKPLFRGHNQPRVPTELGYYDLRLPEVREEQAQLARDAGVTAFCYWHYWFGNGKTLIADIFDSVLESGKPDFPFCLGWANHSWYAKNWNSDGTTTNKLLIEQTYPGLEDEKMHFAFLLKAFKDPRYVKVDGRPLLYIFAPYQVPQGYLDHLKQWTKDAGFPGLYLVANKVDLHHTEQDAFDMGYDAVSYQRLGKGLPKGNTTWDKIKRQSYIRWRKVSGFFRHRPPFMEDYRKVYHYLIQPHDADERVIPCILPQWDHTPRSGWNGSLLVHAEPKYFYKHVKEALAIIRNKRPDHHILFLKSWNEWGEGNFMEPDISYGRGFIDALRKAVDEEKE